MQLGYAIGIQYSAGMVISELVVTLWFTVHADSSRCEECGREDQLCCPALVPEMKDGVCSIGMGCTNNIQSISERKCKPCGDADAPCCWDLQTGYTCNDELHCSGTVGGVTRQPQIAARILNASILKNGI